MCPVFEHWEVLIENNANYPMLLHQVFEKFNSMLHGGVAEEARSDTNNADNQGMVGTGFDPNTCSAVHVNLKVLLWPVSCQVMRTPP